MIDFLTEYFHKRWLRKNHINVGNGNLPENEYRRVLNTLRENKIFVSTKQDGIYIRLGGNINKGETNSPDFVKVKSF